MHLSGATQTTTSQATNPQVTTHSLLPPALANNPLLKLDAVLSQRLLQGPAPTGSPPLHQEATGLPLPTLQWVGRTASHIPDGFTAHPSVVKMMETRRYCMCTYCIYCVLSYREQCTSSKH